MKIWSHLEADPTFAHIKDESLSSKRASTFRKVQKLIELNHVPFEVAMGEPEKSMAWVGAVGMYDWSVAARKMLLGQDHVISTGHQMTNLVSNFEYLLLLCFLTVAEF